MAIEQTRLVVGSTARDGSQSVTPPPTTVEIDPVEPGTVYYSQADAAWKIRNPGYAGQLLAVDTNATDGAVALYVYDGSAWIRVTNYAAVIDPNTGQPYDPLASFYNPLAN